MYHNAYNQGSLWSQVCELCWMRPSRVFLMVSRDLASLESLGWESMERLMPSRTLAAACAMAWAHKRSKSSLSSGSGELLMILCLQMSEFEREGEGAGLA